MADILHYLCRFWSVDGMLRRYGFAQKVPAKRWCRCGSSPLPGSAEAGPLAEIPGITVQGAVEFI